MRIGINIGSMDAFLRFPTLLPRWAFGVVLLAAVGCGPSERSPVIRIATAANMQYALADICDAFAGATGQRCELVIGSSGKLTAQIREGAPFDLFVSADLKYPDYLYRLNKAQEAPRVYARGRLVLWTVQEDLDPSLALLRVNTVQRIALANPDLAPYGRAAVQVLEYNGLLEEVAHKLVYGESVSQANQFVESGAAEVGITALSIKNAPPLSGRGQWFELRESEHEPIEQAVVLLTSEEGPSGAALDFYNYLFSEQARKILQDHGYGVDE